MYRHVQQATADANLLVKLFWVCDAINQLEKGPMLTSFKVGLLSPVVDGFVDWSQQIHPPHMLVKGHQSSN